MRKAVITEHNQICPVSTNPEELNAIPSTIPFERQQRIPRYTPELLLLERNQTRTSTRQNSIKSKTSDGPDGFNIQREI
jgi:hypothetical protein